MKSERIEIRVTEAEKSTIKRAAEMVNMSISEFVLFTSCQQANKIIVKKAVASE